VKRLRDALDDSAENPRFIETLPQHGYRFIASVAPDPLHRKPASFLPRSRGLFLVAGTILVVAILFSLWMQVAYAAKYYLGLPHNRKSLACSAPTDKYLWRFRTGKSGRRHDGRADNRAFQDWLAQSRFAHIGHAIQRGKEKAVAADWPPN
jgi:hypothetical protein